MAITECDFDNEMELQAWVCKNIHDFLGDVTYLDGFKVSTTSGKGGIPDGFAFNLTAKEWFVIENELLAHGVWPHIAEQVTRFVVAMKNPQTRRSVRDRLFEHICAAGAQDDFAGQLGVSTDRLLQQVELFVEGVQPELAIFIDSTNQDLHDMAQALDVPVRIFRIQKFIVNGQAEYHSPDRHVPTISTEPDDADQSGATDLDILEHLGGGKLETSVRQFRCYRLRDETIINIKRSKYHDKNDYYWYGMGASAWGYMKEYSVTHVVFVMGSEGFAKVPIATVEQFMSVTRVSTNEDGSVRHHHCLISPGPAPELYWSNQVERFDLSDCYFPFE